MSEKIRPVKEQTQDEREFHRIVAEAVGRSLAEPAEAHHKPRLTAMPNPVISRCTEPERYPDCPTCQERLRNPKGLIPWHDGSRNCESGSIAAGGTVAHCTCDTCF